VTIENANDSQLSPTPFNFWLYLSGQFESRFKGLVGAAHRLRAACETLGYRSTPNLAACRQLLT
jgi:hypothetical protein